MSDVQAPDPGRPQPVPPPPRPPWRNDAARLDPSCREERANDAGQEVIRETLDRLSHDQAVLVDALGNLRKDDVARLEEQRTAGSPARLMVQVDEAVGILQRRLIALEERMGREGRP